MKKVILSLIVLSLSTFAIAQTNTTITKFVDEKINGLIATGAFDVRISQGTPTGVTIEIREDLAPKLIVDKTEEGFIRINFGSDLGKFFKGNNRPMVTVVVSELSNLNVSGVCKAIGKGEFTATERSAILVGGSAFLEFINVEAPTVTLDVTGSAAVGEITISTPNLRAECGGTSKVALKGTADKAQVTTSGTATLDLLTLTCPDITAVTTGMSLIKANVTGTANVTSGGTSTFKYTGEGKVTGDGKKL